MKSPTNIDDFDFFSNCIVYGESFPKDDARALLDLEISYWLHRNPDRKIYDIQWIDKEETKLDDNITVKAYVGYKFCSKKVKGK